VLLIIVDLLLLELFGNFIELLLTVGRSEAFVVFGRQDAVLGEPRRHEVEHDTDDQREGADTETQQPLAPREMRAVEDAVESGYFDEHRLHSGFNKDDGDEEVVVEDAREDVERAIDLSCVDLVKDLAIHKGIEDHRVVLLASQLDVAQILCVCI